MKVKTLKTRPVSPEDIHTWSLFVLRVGPECYFYRILDLSRLGLRMTGYVILNITTRCSILAGRRFETLPMLSDFILGYSELSVVTEATFTYKEVK